MLYDCSNVLVKDSTITNCYRDGFATCDYVAGNQPNGIVNSIITFCGWNGMTLGSGGPLTIGAYAINNTVAYCSGVGITNYGISNKVIGNYIHDMNGTTHTVARWGIGVEENGYELIANNTIVNVGTGICVAPDTASGAEQAKSNFITNNTITGATVGISSSGSGNDVITFNTVTNWGTGYAFGINEYYASITLLLLTPW
jgi:parallel beta-helix repeat protein